METSTAMVMLMVVMLQVSKVISVEAHSTMHVPKKLLLTAVTSK
jgi:hypothetical protein